MLRQDVNLYTSFKEPTSSKDWLSFENYIIYNMIFFCLMIIIYLFSTWQNHQLNKEKLQTQKNIAQLQSQFYKLRQQFPPVFFAKDVTESVKQIQKEIIAQEQILETVTNATPFSIHLMTLSETIVPNVWLTSISISKGGTDVELEGLSTSVENLQSFFANISHSSLYANYDVSSGNILKNNPNGSGNLTFEASIIKKAS